MPSELLALVFQAPATDSIFTTESIVINAYAKSTSPLAQVRIRGYSTILVGASSITCTVRVRQSTKLTAGIPSGTIVFDSGTVAGPANSQVVIPFDFIDTTNWVYSGSDYVLTGFASSVLGSAWGGAMSVEGLLKWPDSVAPAPMRVSLALI